jgi:choline dehydrogenase-like flavoprotein
MSASEFDVVVVGSGPVGSAFAATIAAEGGGFSVALIEAGPIVSSPPGRHVKSMASAADVARAQERSQGGHSTVEPTSGRVAARAGTYLVGDGVVGDGETGMPAAAMSTNVGGMGSHWTCACPSPGEGERIPWIPREEFEQVFHDAEHLLHVTQNAFEGWPLGDEVRAVLSTLVDEGREPDRRVQPMPLGISISPEGDRYWTGPDVILDDAIESGFVTLFPETLVVRIEITDGAARGVTVRDAVGGERRIGARMVFVAADSFRTPRLLHVSGIRPPALGRYLNDHIQVMALARLDDRFIPQGEATAKPHARGLELFSGVNWIPYDRDTFPFHGQIMQMDASPIPLSGVDEPWPGSFVGIGLFGCKDIRAEDRVWFDDDELDESGLPRICIDYRLTEADHATIRGMKEAAGRLAEALGGLVGDDRPTHLPNGNSLHYMGTVRMGEHDDGNSVCDSFGRVWGILGLAVGGNGVIPTPTACNPTATSVALAIRAARRAIDDLTSYQATQTEETPHAS